MLRKSFLAHLIVVLAIATWSSAAWGMGVEDVRGQVDSVSGIAHRTCWRQAPENSIAGIEACIQLGITMTEVDVRRTADGELVLMHDETIDRTTLGTGRIDELTYPELKGLRLRTSDDVADDALSDQAIPRLADALRIANGKIILCLDIKEDIFHDIISVVDAADARDQVVFLWLKPLPDLADSSLLNHLGEVHIKPSVVPNIADKKVRGPMVREILQSYSTINPIALTVSAKHAPKLKLAIEILHEKHIPVWVTTIKEERRSKYEDTERLHAYWASLADRGVNLIQTDRPAELVEFLRARNHAN